MADLESVSELLDQAEKLLAAGEKTRAASFLDKALRLDFTHPRLWALLHHMVGRGRPFEQFQAEFARRHYPELAHLLVPKPPEPAAAGQSEDPPSQTLEASASTAQPVETAQQTDIAQPVETIQQTETTRQTETDQQTETAQPSDTAPPVETASAIETIQPPETDQPAERALPPGSPGLSPVDAGIPADPAARAADQPPRICPNCQHSNRRVARFCVRCGARLDSSHGAAASLPLRSDVSGSASIPSPTPGAPTQAGKSATPLASFETAPLVFPVPGGVPGQSVPAQPSQSGAPTGHAVIPPPAQSPQGGIPAGAGYAPPPAQPPPPGIPAEPGYTPSSAQPPQPPVARVVAPPAAIPPIVTTSPAPGSAAPQPAAPAVTCPNCGRTNLSDARLCAYCGYEFYQIRQPQTPQPKEKSPFRLHFVDLGSLVVTISLLLPWTTHSRGIFQPAILNIWGAIAYDSKGAAGLAIAFIVLSLGATILVRARQRWLAIAAAVASLVCGVLLANEFNEAGPALAALGAFLTLIGVITFENEPISRFLKRYRKAIALGIIMLLVFGFVILVALSLFQQAQDSARSKAMSTEHALTQAVYTAWAAPTRTAQAARVTQTALGKLQRTQVAQSTASILTQTAAASAIIKQAYQSTKIPAMQTRQANDIPLAGAELQKYQLLYINYTQDFGDRIYVANGDGSSPMQVVSMELQFQSCPRLSPDRRWIAFSPIYKAGSSTHELWLADTSTGQASRLYNYAECPVWSPDGRMLAFVTRGAIHRINLDGSGLVSLVPIDLKLASFSLSWSPDGTTIAYVSGGEIFLIDSNGGNLRQLTTKAAGIAWTLSYSPDGSMIAYSWEDQNGDIDLYLMTKDGAFLRRMTFDGLGNHYPTWSPDGLWIGFSGQYNRSLQFFVMRADGSGGLLRVPVSGKHVVFAP